MTKDLTNWKEQFKLENWLSLQNHPERIVKLIEDILKENNNNWLETIKELKEEKEQDLKERDKEWLGCLPEKPYCECILNLLNNAKSKGLIK
jgi:predicted ribonuclease YlaK